MEDKKNSTYKGPKEVKLNVGSMGGEKKKLTYEQLNDVCNQLWMQNRQLTSKNRELEQFALNKRLEYLFKVLEYSNNFTSDFVVSCSNEIEEALTIPQSNEENAEEESKREEKCENKGGNHGE